MADCVFCDLSKIEGVEWVLTSSPTKVFRFPPLNPVTEGHMLFVPEHHVPDAAHDPMVTRSVFEAAAWWVRSNGIEANIITSIGKAATQSVFHLHVHVVPRTPGDGLLLPWSVQQAEATHE